MKKKIWISLVLVVCLLVFMLAACQSAPESQSNETTTQNEDAAPDDSSVKEEDVTEENNDYSDFRIALCLGGVITDNDWCTAIYNSVMKVQEKYGVQVDYSEQIDVSDMEEYLRSYAEQGYNLVIAHGSQFADNVNAVAPSYPDTLFAITYGMAYIGESDNVICVGPYNIGYLAGIVAGNLTETNKIACLGSTENPSIVADLTTFEMGVHAVNPDAEVKIDWIGSATDVDKAKEMTAALIQQGYDVFSQSANAAGFGIDQACTEYGAYSVPMSEGHYEQNPEAVVVGSTRNFSDIYLDIFDKIIDGSIEPGLYGYGIADNGVILTDWNGWDEKLPEQYAAIMEYVNGIKDGTYEEPEPQIYTR